MTGLETRGYYPSSIERGALARYLDEVFDRDFRLKRPTLTHQAIWGVACGPALSMVNPPNLRGIKSLLEG